MKNPLIAVDVDDVLLDFVPSLIKYCNLHFGTTSAFEDFTRYELHFTWNCTPEEVFERVFKFYNSEEFKHLPPMTGAYDTLLKLKNRFDFVVISSRPFETYDRTVDSIEKLFPGIFDDFYLTDSFKKNGIKPGKGKLCRQLGVESIIDDSFTNALDCVDYGIKVLLYERPWNNQIGDREMIKKVRSWKEIGSVLPEY